jgi:hypothetical protein
MAWGALLRFATSSRKAPRYVVNQHRLFSVVAQALTAIPGSLALDDPLGGCKRASGRGFSVPRGRPARQNQPGFLPRKLDKVWWLEANRTILCLVRSTDLPHCQKSCPPKSLILSTVGSGRFVTGKPPAVPNRFAQTIPSIAAPLTFSNQNSRLARNSITRAP